MAKGNNNFNFNIPIPIIVFAYIVYWPIGIVLTILRAVSKPSGSSGSSSGNREIRETYSKSYQKQQKKQNRNKRKTSPAVVILTLLGAFNSFVALTETMNWIYDFGYFLEYAFPWIIAAALCFVGAGIFKKRNSRLNAIRSIIGDRESLNLTKLASACGVDIKKVRKDLQRLIDKGEFGESAYIDLGTNNFMRTPYAEPDDPDSFDYRTVYGDLLKKDKKEKKTEKTVEEAQTPAEDTAEKAPDSDNFKTIIREIRRLNDEIKDIAVSDRIDKIEAHTKNIFDYVTDHPDAMPQIRTFMNYYLPTTLKLLESYSRIERVGVAGENMKKSKENIENILDLLAVGFEQQVDQLFKNESIDISSDISVLEKMMQKDGLSGKQGFDIASFVENYSDKVTDEVSDELGAGAAAQAEPDDK